MAANSELNDHVKLEGSETGQPSSECPDAEQCKEMEGKKYGDDEGRLMRIFRMAAVKCIDRSFKTGR